MRRRHLFWLAALSACTATTVSTTTPPATPAETTTTSSSPTTAVTTSLPSSTTTGRSQSDPGAVLVLGDWGSGTLPQGAVAGAMARYAEENRVEAVLTTGDNFYSDDAEFLLEPLEWVFLSNIELWITWGNRDVETATRIEAVELAFDSPPRWTVHEWGEIDVVILDSNQVDSAEQLEFLLEAIEGSDDPTILVFHHPPLSCSLHGDTEAVLEAWVPRFDDEVVMVLSGHDHNYQRFGDAGVIYVVSGGGGRPLYELANCPTDHPQRLAGEAVHHFLALTQGEDSMSVEVVDVNGGTIDSFTVPLP